MKTRRAFDWRLLLLVGTIGMMGWSGPKTAKADSPAYSQSESTGNGFIGDSQEAEEVPSSLLYLFLGAGCLVPFLLMKKNLRRVRKSMQATISEDGKTHYVQVDR
jgi:hypothetical protein